MSARARCLGKRPSAILVWLNGALGDTILSYPALHALRMWAPPAVVSVAGQRDYLSFALDLGLVDRLQAPDGVLATTLFSNDRPTGRVPADLAIVWSSAYSELEHRLLELGVPVVLGAAPRGGEGVHQAEYLLSTLEPLGIPPTIGLPTLKARNLPVDRDLDHSRLPGSRCVLLHPGAGALWKRWPLTGFMALADKLRGRGYTVKWTCGEADADIRNALQSGAHAEQLLPALELRNLAALMPRFSLVVSGDTGIAHLAALCGTQTLTLFGPTDCKRWRPLGPSSYVLEAPNVCGGTWARDAAAVQRTEEPRLRRCAGELPEPCRCLAAIPPEAVVERSLLLLTR